MKVTKTWKGWEPYNFGKREVARWVMDLFGRDRLIQYKNARRLCEMDTDFPTYEKPKRCTLTITYEVED